MKRILALWVSVLVVGSCGFGQEVPPAFEKPGDGKAGDAEDEYDPFDPAINAPKLIRVQVEFVEMSHKDLTRLMMDDKATKADATELRMKVQAMADKDEAKVIDTQMTLGRSGQKQTTESIHEFMYPVEYEPANCLPPKEGEEAVQIPQGPFPFTPALPSMFETRNVGSMLESEPNLGEDGNLIDLRILSEFLWHPGNTVWNEGKDDLGNVSKVVMPDFYKVAINTSITCISGQYVLAGVLSPKDARGVVDPDRKVMVFVKCNVFPVIP